MRISDWSSDVCSSDLEETGRAVRLAAAGPEERLEVLRVEVDSGLRTRRHLGYWEASEWAGEARPVVAALAEAVEVGPTRELVELLQRAVGHVVMVILRADDSNGMVGDLARRSEERRVGEECVGRCRARGWR